MAKLRVAVRLSGAASSTAKWLGRCPECGEWNSLVEETVGAARPAGALVDAAKPRADRRRARRRRAAHARPASASSIACSAAGWCRARWCCSAAIPASASRRCCLQALDGLARAGRAGALRLGRGVGAADRAARRAAGRARAASCWCWPRRSSSASSTQAEARASRRCWRSTRSRRCTRRRSSRSRASLGQVREAAGRLLTFAKSRDVPVDPRRSRHQGRRARRTEDARARGRRGALLRGRARPALSHPARHQESLRLDQRDRRLRDARRRAGRGAEPVGAVPRRAAARRAGLGGGRRGRGLAADPRRDPGAGGVARPACRGAPRSASIPTASRCCWR